MENIVVGDPVSPKCPFCKMDIDLSKDLLWDSCLLEQGGLAMNGASVVYCAHCGAILGGSALSSFSKRRRD